MPVNYICPSETNVSAHSHREKVPSVCASVLPFIADAVSANPIDHMGMVHLQLSPSEWKKIPDAIAAVQKEYDQLAALPAWDMKNVCEYSQVAERAASTGKTIYFGRIFHWLISNILSYLLTNMFIKEDSFLEVITFEMRMAFLLCSKSKVLLLVIWFVPNSWMLSPACLDAMVKMLTPAKLIYKLISVNLKEKQRPG